jgi:hypothetical protein
MGTVDRFLPLVADADVGGARDCDVFLSACEVAAAGSGGHLSVNAVPRILADAVVVIEPRRYPALWNVSTCPGRPMRWAGPFELRAGSLSRNDGKYMRIRQWVGWDADDGCLEASPMAAA